MENTKSVLMDRGKRSALAAVGLAVCAVGTYFELQADLGMAPWEALNQGLAEQFHTTYGTACIAVALLVIVADLLLKERIGIGTVLDAFLVGTFVDICVAGRFVSVPETLAGKLCLLIMGIITICFGQALYMKAGLCCGPRDALLVGLGKRAAKMPIGLVNISILTTVLAVCIPLGSPIGLGTVVCAFGTGVIMEGVFRLMHFKPRQVVHESLLETIRQLMGKPELRQASYERISTKL